MNGSGVAFRDGATLSTANVGQSEEEQNEGGVDVHVCGCAALKVVVVHFLLVTLCNVGGWWLWWF